MKKVSSPPLVSPPDQELYELPGRVPLSTLCILNGLFDLIELITASGANSSFP